MTAWKSMLGVVLALGLLPATAGAQDGLQPHPPRNPVLPNTWMTWPQTPTPVIKVAVRAGRMFDSKTGKMLTKQVVIIDGDKITAVGPEGTTAIPAGYKVIDLSNATVMPGLIDAHTHMYESAPKAGESAVKMALTAVESLQSMLLAGITTCREASTHGNGNGDVDIRNAIDAGQILGPRVSPAATGIQPLKDPRGPDAIRAAVRAQIAMGADHLKIFPTSGYSFTPDGQIQFAPGGFTLEELQALVDEAHKNHVRVMAHAYGGDGLMNSIIAGVDSIEHGQGLTQEMVDMMVKKGLYYNPTIVRYTLASIDANDKKKTDGKYSIVPIFEKNVRMAIATPGLKVVFGTGVDGGIYQYGSEGREFVALTKYGMTPARALMAATSLGAENMGPGWEEKVGSIEKGKYADLVAVSGDPLQDITTMENVKFVMKGGYVVKNQISGVK